MKFRTSLLALAAASFPHFALAQTPAQTKTNTPSRPNIVFILADDLGYMDTGFTGSDFFETPNLDRLAKQGMVFNAAYASAANCAPSRACLLSGQYTPRHEVYAVGSTDRGPKTQQRLVPIPNKSGLAPSMVTVAEALKAGGYSTAMFGKWHLSGPDGASPKTQGFDMVYDPVKINDPDGERNAAGPPQDPKNVFAMTEAVGQFMEKESKQNHPFFAYVAHDAVHRAWGARPETLERFRAKPKGKLQGNALFGACVYDFDESVGRLMQRIKDLGIEKNTLVVFTSDNGGVTGQNLSQEPLRGNKGAYYEGGIREPMWAIWPGVIQPGTTNTTPVISVDFFPTFLDVAGTPAPAGKVLDGESIAPLFKGGRSLKREAIYWHFPGYLNNPVDRGRDPIFRTRPVTVIRKGDWKLFLYHEEWQLEGGEKNLATNHAVELYNLQADPGEHRDVANEDLKKRDELLRDLLAWQKKTGATLPSQLNPGYAPRNN